MKKGSTILLVCLSALVIAGLACGKSEPAAQETPGPAATEEAVGPSATEEPAPSGDHDTEFPLPEKVENFMDLGGGAINFQTDLSIEEAIAFYRQAFADAGLTEREINTAITESTFSMVFDGWPGGKTVVIQGVDLGGSSNINIRFEDV